MKPEDERVFHRLFFRLSEVDHCRGIVVNKGGRTCLTQVAQVEAMN